MDKEKTILEKVEALFLTEEKPVEETVSVELEEEVVELAEAVTDKGVIKYENLEEGAAIVLVLEDGTEEPANGEYTFEDGTVIVVKDGMLESVAEVVVEEEEQSEEVNPLEQDVADLKEAVATILEKFTAYSESFEAFKKAPAKEEFKAPKKDVVISSKDNALNGLLKFRTKK